MQGRGLKRSVAIFERYQNVSPLMQGRGLKQHQSHTCRYHQVAPHAGAWIETTAI